MKAEDSRIRVGLVGVGNWARYGHIPALHYLSDSYELVAVSSRQASRASEIAREFSIPYAFGEHLSLIEHPDVDMVVVLPPAPEHYQLTRAAMEAGKDVYCEWPLTTSTRDSVHLLAIAKATGVRHAVGLQRRMGPSARYLRDLLKQGYLGALRSVRMHVSIEYFGSTRPPSLEWTLPAANYSHLLSIYGGHFFDMLFHIVGPPTTVNAIAATQFPTLTLSRTEQTFPNETPDAVLAQGQLASGGLFTVQIEAGKHNNAGLQIDFTGTEGDLRVTNTKAFGNAHDNRIEGAESGHSGLEILPVPDQYLLPTASSLDASVEDLVHLYRAFAHPVAGTYQAPDFADALEMHRFLDAMMAASEARSTQLLTTEIAHL